MLLSKVIVWIQFLNKFFKNQKRQLFKMWRNKCTLRFPLAVKNIWNICLPEHTKSLPFIHHSVSTTEGFLWLYTATNFPWIQDSLCKQIHPPTTTQDFSWETKPVFMQEWSTRLCGRHLAKTAFESRQDLILHGCKIPQLKGHVKITWKIYRLNKSWLHGGMGHFAEWTQPLENGNNKRALQKAQCGLQPENTD